MMPCWKAKRGKASGFLVVDIIENFADPSCLVHSKFEIDNH